MKHKGLVARLCYHLSEGYGINQALSLEGLTTTYLTERIRRIDRVRLHQAHSVYREGLQREIVQRARLGRDITRLERALDNLPPLSLPGDDEDEERAHRKGRRNFAGDDMSTELFPSDLADLHRFLNIDDEADAAEADDEDEAEPEPKPAEKAPAASRRRLQISETPLALESPQAVEEPHQRRSEASVAEEPDPDPEPPPESKLRWFRLYTGRAVLRAADGTIVRELMPGQLDYPHHTEFVNWE